MPQTHELDAWLDEGAPPEADWAPYILQRALSGELGDGGPGLLLDLPPLLQPYACRSRLCSPRTRAPEARSCCADLDVGISERDQAALEAALPQITSAMEGDSRWSDGVPQLFEDDQLCRPGGTCVFARLGPDDLTCGLHAAEDATGQPRGALKPIPCRLFPLAVVDLGDGRLLLTAVHRDTAALLATRPARVFPCLSAAATPLFAAERATLTEVFGADVYACIEANQP